MKTAAGSGARLIAAYSPAYRTPAQIPNCAKSLRSRFTPGTPTATLMITIAVTSSTTPVT